MVARHTPTRLTCDNLSMETVGVEYPDLAVISSSAVAERRPSTHAAHHDQNGRWWLAECFTTCSGSHELRGTTDVLFSLPSRLGGEAFRTTRHCLLLLVSHQLKIFPTQATTLPAIIKTYRSPAQVVSNLHNCHGTEMTPLPPAPENLQT